MKDACAIWHETYPSAQFIRGPVAPAIFVWLPDEGVMVIAEDVTADEVRAAITAHLPQMLARAS